jgi:hypothetical protein
MWSTLRIFCSVSIVVHIVNTFHNQIKIMWSYKYVTSHNFIMQPCYFITTQNYTSMLYIMELCRGFIWERIKIWYCFRGNARQSFIFAKIIKCIYLLELTHPPSIITPFFVSFKPIICCRLTIWLHQPIFFYIMKWCVFSTFIY